MDTSKGTELVTRAEAARRWGLTRQAITAYVRHGMPTSPYGKLLDWREVEAWRRMYISPYASCNWRFRQRQKEQRPMSPREYMLTLKRKLRESADPSRSVLHEGEETGARPSETC